MRTRMAFEAELNLLEQSIQDMSEQVEQAFVQVVKGMNQKDVLILKTVVSSDRLINDMQRSIEARCLTLITKQSPVAKDLRMVSAALKVVTDIERMGDHAADIAELLIRMNIADLSEYSSHLDGMLTVSIEMIRNATKAFITKDSVFAEEVIKSDDIVDEIYGKVRADIIRNLQQDGNHADAAVDALMIGKYLERVADHAVNICEWEEFQDTGIIEEHRLM